MLGMSLIGKKNGTGTAAPSKYRTQSLNMAQPQPQHIAWDNFADPNLRELPQRLQHIGGGKAVRVRTCMPYRLLERPVDV
jgi:hypothetical protein